MSAPPPQHATPATGRDERLQTPGAPPRQPLSVPTHSLFPHFTVRDGESDKDAAERILLVLEKGMSLARQAASDVSFPGLRSSSIIEAVETVFFFPIFFARHPIPSVITLSFLMLGDHFFAGSNFVRAAILRVTLQSKALLAHVQNLDEVVRRFYSVIHSNDPIARSLTLRLFASFASQISGYKNVHHA